MCVMGKNENSYYISILSYLPIVFANHGQITQKLKEQEFSFLFMTHILISWANL